MTACFVQNPTVASPCRIWTLDCFLPEILFFIVAVQILRTAFSLGSDGIFYHLIQRRNRFIPYSIPLLSLTPFVPRSHTGSPHPVLSPSEPESFANTEHQSRRRTDTGVSLIVLIRIRFPVLQPVYHKRCISPYLSDRRPRPHSGNSPTKASSVFCRSCIRGVCKSNFHVITGQFRRIKACIPVSIQTLQIVGGKPEGFCFFLRGKGRLGVMRDAVMTTAEIRAAI